MNNKRFPPNFPDEIIRRYNKRKWRFTIRGKYRGVIENFRFFHQKGSGKEEFWKGIEKLRFDEDKRIEYRFCYWANLGNGWKWGQFCPFFPKDILAKVLDVLNNKEI
jgi:hypothetical protein